MMRLRFAFVAVAMAAMMVHADEVFDESKAIEKIELLGGKVTREKLRFFRPSPISVEDATKGTLLVKTEQFPQQGLVAVAKAGRGDVVVLGASLWWNWIASQQESGADNAKLLQNLLNEQASP